MRKLTLQEIQQELKKLTGWHYVDAKIVKEFRFANFPTAVLFVNKLVNPIEELDHHPALLLTYDRITLTLFTHEAGALTDRDFILAQRIDALYQ